MIRVNEAELSDAAARALAQLQDEVDREPTYAGQVATAKRIFEARNRASNPTFREVREKLGHMCSGARRCMYCEDSVADEVEHIRPKAFYPEAAFNWRNLLFACGSCNGPKGSSTGVVDAATLSIVEYRRRVDDPIVPPQIGQPALIDPRAENPLTFFDLDLLGSFWFLVAEGLDPVSEARAEFTLRTLRLNVRDMLVDARRSAYGSYKARLFEYVKLRDSGAGVDDLARLQNGIQAMHHPTVWAEMKRIFHLMDDLRPLFDSAPEALLW